MREFITAVVILAIVFYSALIYHIFRSLLRGHKSNGGES
jgi:hypothetical protein